MKFVEEKKAGFEFKSTSKSRLTKYQKCPALAYRSLRETKQSLEENHAIEIGNLSHELAAQELHKLQQNKDFEYDFTRLEKYRNLSTYAEAVENFKWINLRKILEGQAVIEIEKEISIPMPEVDEGFMLKLKPDALTYMSIDKHDYIGIIEFKTGYSDITQIDSELILYCYAIAKKYSLPVSFQRINLSNGKKFEKKFSRYEIGKLHDQIVIVMKKWKEDMEGDIIPEVKPGSHCSYCHYLNKCSGRKYVSTLRQKYKAVIILKELAKKYEAEIKQAAKEELDRHPEYVESVGEHVLLPFLDNKYGAISKTISFNSLAKRALKKDEVKDLLIQHVLMNPTPENIEMLKESMELSLTDQVSNILDSGGLRETIENYDNEGVKSVFKNGDYSIPIKRVVKSSIAIKAEMKAEEDEENE